MSRFVARHKHEWAELEALLAKARRGAGRMTSEEIGRLDQLYRRATVHLSRVSSWTDDQPLVEYLNQLTAAAHSFVYLSPRKSLWVGLARFVTEGFARSIWRNRTSHLLSITLMVVGGLIGYGVAVSDPLLAHAVWPASDMRQPGSSPEQLLEVLRDGRDDNGGVKFAFASMLFQHNFKVGLLAMATGILAGIPSVLLMGFNGMLLGGFVAIHHNAGIREEMWAWILPHGVTELSAIALCGGVGLMLGRSVLDPGSISREQKLKQIGYEAARTCAGVGLMLLAAAVIESYVRQSHWSTTTRLWFAAATAVFWIAYIAWGAFRERQDKLARDTALSAINTSLIVAR